MMSLLLLGTALGYECVSHKTPACPASSKPSCATWSGGTAAFDINVNDFSAAELTEFDAALLGWKAGAGEVNRGASFAFVRSDITHDGGRGNGVSEVRKKDATTFHNHFPAGWLAAVEVWLDPTDCGRIVETDMTIKDGSFLVTTPPLESDSIDPQEYSFGQLVLHELGHMAGLAHESIPFILSTMDHTWPHGGDLGEMGYRIQESDFVGLRALYPGASTGGNLMLSRFRWVSLSQAPSAKLAWTSWERVDPAEGLPDDGRTWAACPGELVPTQVGPWPVIATITGADGGTASPQVEWRLDTGLCFTGVGYTLATRTPTLVINTPFQVEPSQGYQVPANTPPGLYTLCARIDANEQISESSELDNTVMSDKKFEVLTCPP